MGILSQNDYYPKDPSSKVGAGEFHLGEMIGAAGQVRRRVREGRPGGVPASASERPSHRLLRRTGRACAGPWWLVGFPGERTGRLAVTDRTRRHRGSPERAGRRCDQPAGHYRSSLVPRRSASSVGHLMRRHWERRSVPMWALMNQGFGAVSRTSPCIVPGSTPRSSRAFWSSRPV